MVYSFKHSDRSVQEQLREIADYQIAEALDSLASAQMERGAIVHDVRKRCKKLRGLIRLVRKSFPDYKSENAAFREVAHLFDDFRDAKVMQDTYDLIVEAFDEQIDRSAFSSIRAEFTRRRTALASDDEWAQRREEARGKLEKARRRAREWSLDDEGWEAIGGGLAKTYRRARKAMATARDEPSGENLHEWRKRTKYHWYHTRLIKKIAPHLLEPRAMLLHELSDILGDHHDLHVFATQLEAEPTAFADGDTRAILAAMIERRSAELEQEAWREGDRLLCDETDALVARLGEWWEVWQRDEQPLAVG
jgi:CHAD domain-containing protein